MEKGSHSIKGPVSGTIPAGGHIEPLEDRIAPASLTGALAGRHKTSAHPATAGPMVVVTSLADTATSINTPGTLAYAINYANNNAGTTIDFGTPSKPLKGTINLKSASLPAITNTTYINGPGVTINGDGKYQDLVINGYNLNVTITGITFTNGSGLNGGNISVNSGGGAGGDTIILDAVKIENGKAATGAGLYLYDIGGAVTITNSTISGNHAAGAKGALSNGSNAMGGGIANMAGSLYLYGVTVSKNSATGGNGSAGPYGGGNGIGGGIYNGGGAGTVTIGPTTVMVKGKPVTVNSSITGNTATGGNGGAGLNYTFDRATQSSYYGTAGGAGGLGTGGGIANKGGAISIVGATISGNIAKGGSGGNGGKTHNGANAPGGSISYPGGDGNPGYAGGAGGKGLGGGAYDASTCSLTIQKTSVTGNTATAGNGGNGGAAGNGGNGSKPISYNGYHYASGVGGSGGQGGDGGASGVAAGGGIFSAGTLVVKTSTLSGNTAAAGKSGKGGAGGKKGSGSYTSYGTVMSGSNGVAGITPTAYFSLGGGLYSYGGAYPGSNKLIQVTIAKNTAGDGGGAALVSAPPTEIANSTIALNKSLVTGGGLFVTPDPYYDPVNVVSTIIAKNTAGKNGAPDLYGEVTAAFTLISSNTGFTLDADSNKDPNFAGITTSVIGTSLAFHDHGTMQTLLPTIHAPSTANSTLNVPNNLYSNPYGYTTDQNGVTFSTFYIGAVSTTT